MQIGAERSGVTINEVPTTWSQQTKLTAADGESEFPSIVFNGAEPISAEVAPGDVQEGSRLVADLGADSLDTVELVMALEEEFETEIPDEDAEKIQTVQDAVSYITEHV